MLCTSSGPDGCGICGGAPGGCPPGGGIAPPAGIGGRGAIGGAPPPGGIIAGRCIDVMEHPTEHLSRRPRRTFEHFQVPRSRNGLRQNVEAPQIDGPSLLHRVAQVRDELFELPGMAKQQDPLAGCRRDPLDDLRGECRIVQRQLRRRRLSERLGFAQQRRSDHEHHLQV